MQSCIRFRLILLAVLLLQAQSSFGQTCLINTLKGLCKRNRMDCWTSTTIKCGNTGKFCCPNRTPARETGIYQPNPKFPKNCGNYTEPTTGFITGGFTIKPDVYSWIASLEYNSTRDSLGICAGSVINSLYVLTAAHCVDETSRNRYGNV